MCVDRTPWPVAGTVQRTGHVADDGRGVRGSYVWAWVIVRCVCGRCSGVCYTECAFTESFLTKKFKRLKTSV